LFEQGRITSSGKPEDLISQYLNGLTKKTDSQTLADYRTGEVKAGFYQEVRINGELLPAEIVVDSQSCLCITLYGNTWAARHRDFRSGVHFHTQDGIRIFSVATPWSSLGHFDAEGRVRLDCRIDQLPLIPGRYLLSIGAGSAGQMLDWLESVCVLMVTPEPGVETDLLPDYKTHGYFRVGATWSFSRHPLVVHSTRRDISSGRLP
jgi:hypothetical protein